ncbi:M20/M25/M40 family metallo-hydrolase [uncultured Sphaerochaeta sp.]|uniref:M20/M25/M40 family metallo-hydrolase n=1 Tax=uncultured Sphaerochaeta sp. TaxID=886478 RepID=UPI003749B46E
MTAHQDVRFGPFPRNGKEIPLAAIFQDFIWGRGSFDCKLQLIAILQAFEEMLQSGLKPKRTWYAAFGCDEEVNGGTRGANLIDSHLGKWDCTSPLYWMREGL